MVNKFQIGDRVEALFHSNKEKKWSRGKIVRKYEDGSYDIKYNNAGDVDTKLSLEFIREIEVRTKLLLYYDKYNNNNLSTTQRYAE